MTLKTKLKTIVFMGSARNKAAHWGGDVRLGDRVLKHVVKTLSERTKRFGDETITHDTQVVDPREVFGKDGALSELSAGELLVPTYYVKELPPKAQVLKDQITGADCYLIVSPEYNHVVPPALSSIMGHFGGSCYITKPCGIVTYSPGPWGGQRGALSIVTMTHGLGCLPVSKMVGYPLVASIFDEDGTPIDPEHSMLEQLPEMLSQLEWIAVAMKNQKEKVGSW